MSLNSPYHLYIRDIKLTGNSYIYPLTNYKARYTTPKIGIIKENITNLTFYLNLYAHYLNVKQLYFENSSLPINWNDSYISESSARTLDLLDLSGRPINFNSSSASFIFGGSSASTATSMINTVIKLNCNSNFPANNNFGILKYSINTTKLVLTGTGLTSITNNILYGDIPQLEEIVFPESLSSISGSLFMKFLISGNRRLIMTFTRATPATMTSTIEAGSGISASNLKIRVPQGSLSAYTSATNYPDPSRCIYVEYDPVTGEDIISE